MPTSSRVAARCRGGSRVSMGGGDAGLEGAPVTFTERTLPDTQPPELHASAAQTSVPTTGPAAGFSPGRSSWRPCPKERFSPAHPGSSERRTGTRRMRGNTGGFGGPRLEPAHCHFVYVPSAEAGPRAKTRAFGWGSLRAPGPGAPRQVSTVTSSQQGAPPGRSSGAPGTEPRGCALRSARAHCASGRLREDFLGHAAGRGAPGSPVSCPRPDRRELRSARSGRRSRWTALRRPDPAPPKTVRLTLLQGWPRTSSHGCRFASVCPMPRAAGDRRVTARRSCATPAHLGGQATACSYALTFTGGEWGQKSALDPRPRLCAPRSVGTFPSVHQAAVGVDSGLVRICVMVQRARTLE